MEYTNYDMQEASKKFIESFSKNLKHFGHYELDLSKSFNCTDKVVMSDDELMHYFYNDTGWDQLDLMEYTVVVDEPKKVLPIGFVEILDLFAENQNILSVLEGLISKCYIDDYYATEQYGLEPYEISYTLDEWVLKIMRQHYPNSYSNNHYHVWKQDKLRADSKTKLMSRLSVKEFNHYADVFSEKTGFSLLLFSNWFVNDKKVVEFDEDECKEIIQIFTLETSVEKCLRTLVNAGYIECFMKAKYPKHRFVDLAQTFSHRLDDWIVSVLENINIYNIINEKEDDIMGLRIKKTDFIDIDDFMDNTKAYDSIVLLIDEDEYDKFKEDYGLCPFAFNREDKGYVISDAIIEFKEKAILVNGSTSIPYSVITGVEATYYLTTEN